MATITVQAPVKEEIQSLGAYKEFAAGPGKYSQADEEEGEGKATVRISHSEPLSYVIPASRLQSRALVFFWLDLWSTVSELSPDLESRPEIPAIGTLRARRARPRRW